MIYVCSSEVDLNNTLEGKTVITTIDKLYQIVVRSDCEEIHINKDFAEANFTTLKLNNFIEEVSKLNPDIKIIADSLVINPFKDSIGLINSIKSKEDLMKYMMLNKDATFKLFKYLCANNNKSIEDSLSYGNKLNTLQLELLINKQELDIERDKYSHLAELYNLSRTKLDLVLSRIKYTTGKNLDMSILSGIDVKFSKYDRILYIKEITRVKYIDTLLYYLQEILAVTYSVPARLVVVEAAFAYKRARLYPRCKSQLELTYRDIAQEDIFMAGFNNNLMSMILLNTSNVPYLIVLDRCGWEVPLLYGDNVETIYTASDLEDLEHEDINDVISYSKDSLYVPFIKDFDILPPEVKIQKYSEMTVVKRLLDILERGKDGSK